MTSHLPNLPNTPPSSFLASRIAQSNGQPMPSGEPVASFVRHDDALAAMDVLTEQDFPVTALYLVNDGIRQVEYPVQAGYSRALLASAVQGVVIGLVYSAIVAAGGTDFISAALSTVPISVAIFVLWRVFDLRRGQGIRYPMRSEAIPTRTVVYALPEYAQEARRILGPNSRFSAAVDAAHSPSQPTNAPAPSSAQHAQGSGEQKATPQGTTPMNGAPAPGAAPKAPSHRTPTTSQPDPKQNVPFHDANVQDTPPQSADQTHPAQPSQQIQPTQHDQPARAPRRPAQRFGLRVDDPEEYAKLIQPKPERPTPRPKGLREDHSGKSASEK